MKISIRTFLVFALFLSAMHLTAQIVNKKYHLGAFVRLQGHPEFTVSWSEFNRMMNDPNEHSFSFKSFLNTTSFGQLDYEFVSVKRANSDTIPYYYDIMPYGYYGQYSASNPNGWLTKQDSERRNSDLTSRYIMFLNENLSDDVNLDGDGDGRVDIISFISPGFYPGPIEGTYNGNWAGGIPTHNYNSLKIKGLGIGRFSVTIADSWNNVQANGIFKHEVGHNLGTWDLYDSNNTPGQRFVYRNLVGDPVGAWNMMTGASHTYGAYVIWSQLNYLTDNDVKILHQSGTYRLNSLFSNSKENVTYRINSPNSKTEFFILEFRPRHKTLEWWHNSEGLLVSLVNPHVRGNPRNENNPRSFELFYLRDKEGNVLFNNTTLSENSIPSLRMSDGTTAGFKISNIRIENNQLVFELLFDDVPTINATQFPEIVSSAAQSFSWQIETNISNKDKWKASTTDPWFTLKENYNDGLLTVTCNRNFLYKQRNATITLSAPGVSDIKLYFVQRGTSTMPVLWLPEITNDTVYIEGEENSHNVKIIGDLNGDWWGGDNSITNGAGYRRYLHSSVNPIYAYRNSTTLSRTARIFYKLTDGSQKSFVVKQRPATNTVPSYASNNGVMPVVDDGKWYYIRTERAMCTLSNFLKPVSQNNTAIVGTGNIAYTDSLLWTIESSSNGVVLRNKALGYLDLNNLKGVNVSFTKIKPATNLLLKPNVNIDGFFAGTAGYAFKGINSNIAGLHVNRGGLLVTNWFDLADNCTFFFDRTDASFYKTYASNLIQALNGFDYFTDPIELSDLQKSITDISDSQLSLDFNNNANAIINNTNKVYNRILNKLNSTNASNDVWFKIKRNITKTWGHSLYEQTDQYLCFEDRYAELEHSLIINEHDKYYFKFEKQNNGYFNISNKSQPNFKVSSNGSSLKLQSYNPMNVIIRPIVTYRGLKFAFINSATNSYYRYIPNKKQIVLNSISSLNELVDVSSFLFAIEPLELVSSVILPNSIESDLKLYPHVRNRSIHYPLADVKVQVYNLEGIIVPNYNLLDGVYIVKANNNIFKVIVH